MAQGYHAAAMDDIAERAGVSKPVLYQHFPGKLDLYLALLDAACDEVIDNCRQALAATHDNKTRVAAAMAAFYAYVAADGGAFRLVFESDLTSEPAVREHVERVTTECAAMIADVIHDDTGLPARAVAAAGGVAGGNGPGQREVLGLGVPAGINQAAGGGAGQRPGLARDPRLPADRRALTHRRRRTMEVKIGVQHAPRELVVRRPTPPRRSRRRWTRPWPATRHPHAHRHPRAPGPRPRAHAIAYLEIGTGVDADQVGFRG